MVVQDPLHRVPGDVVAEVGECAADPRVAPRRILPRHPYDEFGHRLGVIGRPRRRRALPSYFWAISRRYQRRIVSGVTMPAT